MVAPPRTPFGMKTIKALKNFAICLILFPRFLLAAIMLWFLDFLCIRKMLFKMQESGESADDPPLCISDSNRMCSLESLKAVWHGHKLDFFKSAHLGHDAPNTEVVQLGDNKLCRILEFAKGKRPLILNFGSCT